MRFKFIILFFVLFGVIYAQPYKPTGSQTGSHYQLIEHFDGGVYDSTMFGVIDLSPNGQIWYTSASYNLTGATGGALLSPLINTYSLGDHDSLNYFAYLDTIYANVDSVVIEATSAFTGNLGYNRFRMMIKQNKDNRVYLERGYIGLYYVQIRNGAIDHSDILNYPNGTGDIRANDTVRLRLEYERATDWTTAKIWDANIGDWTQLNTYNDRIIKYNELDFQDYPLTVGLEVRGRTTIDTIMVDDLVMWQPGRNLRLYTPGINDYYPLDYANDGVSGLSWWTHIRVRWGSYISPETIPDTIVTFFRANELDSATIADEWTFTLAHDSLFYLNNFDREAIFQNQFDVADTAYNLGMYIKEHSYVNPFIGEGWFVAYDKDNVNDRDSVYIHITKTDSTFIEIKSITPTKLNPEFGSVDTIYVETISFAIDSIDYFRTFSDTAYADSCYGSANPDTCQGWAKVFRGNVLQMRTNVMSWGIDDGELNWSGEGMYFDTCLAAIPVDETWGNVVYYFKAEDAVDTTGSVTPGWRTLNLTGGFTADKLVCYYSYGNGYNALWNYREFSPGCGWVPNYSVWNTSELYAKVINIDDTTQVFDKLVLSAARGDEFGALGPPPIVDDSIYANTGSGGDTLRILTTHANSFYPIVYMGYSDEGNSMFYNNFEYLIENDTIKAIDWWKSIVVVDEDSVFIDTVKHNVVDLKPWLAESGGYGTGFRMFYPLYFQLYPFIADSIIKKI